MTAGLSSVEALSLLLGAVREVLSVDADRLLAEAPRLDVAAALRLETELQQRVMGTPEQMEAVQAVFEKRNPTFEDR